MTTTSSKVPTAAQKLSASYILKKVLDLIPFDGSKMKISGIFAIFAVLQQFLSDVNFWELLKLILSSNMTWPAVVGILISYIHNKLKDKYPDARLVEPGTGNPVLIQGENAKVVK